jgi:hypothetical protein
VKDPTVLGHLFIRDSLRLGVLASHVAYQHHERQDGKGYPRALVRSNRIARGSEVYVPGRIRPLGEIAAIADLHLRVLSPYPIGSQGVVTHGRWSGHSGVVVRVPHARMELPFIRLLALQAQTRA